MYRNILIILIICLPKVLYAQQPEVKFSGAMSNLHRHLKDSGTIQPDTISGKHLYAIGPVEHLRGEILIWDSNLFVAGVTDENRQPFVTKNPDGVKAIFLAYAHVAAWDTLLLTESPSDMAALEKAIGMAAAHHGIDTSKAFPFLMFGRVKKGTGHIMYKAPDVPLHSRSAIDDAKFVFNIENQRSQFVGFYSHHHQSIFTHHDRYIHIHYRLYNKYHAGHLDTVCFDENEPVRLLLPAMVQQP